MSNNAVFCTVIVICLFTSACFAKYSGGTGDPNDPYLIATPNDLNAIGTDPNDWNKNFKMIADINLADFTGTQFNIIGNYWSPFTGVFDGNHHYITHFTLESNGLNFIGLFLRIDGEDCQIRNVVINDVNIDAGNSEYVGCFVGHMTGGSISNCHVSGGVIKGDIYLGGLVGRSERNSNIVGCSSDAYVIGRQYVGGLMGEGEAIIRKCKSAGSVTGQSYVGGLVGGLLHCRGGEVIDCYSNAQVFGHQYVGGLAGSAYDQPIIYSYSSGRVDGNDFVGGLIGYTECNYNIASFWDVNSSGQLNSALGCGKTTVQMKSVDTFAGWDCSGAWTIDDGQDYPRLIWENRPGQAIPYHEYGGGEGTQENPYLIYTPEQLNLIGASYCDWDKNFVLCTDINLSEYTNSSFNRIGVYYPFIGQFDGQGHCIFNFKQHLSNGINIGLFGFVANKNEPAVIKNLTLVNPDIAIPWSYHVGALVGRAAGYSNETAALLTNCHVSGGAIHGDNRAGGLAGVCRNVTINNCSNDGCIVSGNWLTGGLVADCEYSIVNESYTVKTVIEGDTSAGGLFGRAHNGTIERCYSNSTVKGIRSVGGLSGLFFGNESVKDSYSLGNVSKGEIVGGFVGRSFDAVLENCFAANHVDGNDIIGGFIGSASSENFIKSCFWDVNVTPDINGVGDWSYPNLIGLSTELMKTSAPFVNAGWDFIGETANGYDDIWRMCQDEVDYPRLTWEFTSYGDLTCPDGVDFTDYSVLADQWLLEKLDADMTNDGRVNLRDFAAWANQWEGDYSLLEDITQNWLARSAGIADIAPAGGDDFVDWLDLAKFCENWLGGEK